MKIPSKSQSIYAQLKMLEPTMRYIKDSLNESDIMDLEVFSEMSMICAHLKSVLIKIEHTAAKKRYVDDDN